MIRYLSVLSSPGVGGWVNKAGSISISSVCLFATTKCLWRHCFVNASSFFQLATNSEAKLEGTISTTTSGAAGFDLTLSAQEAVAVQPEVFLPGIANTRRAP